MKYFMPVLIALSIASLSVDDAAAQTRFGLRGGVYLDQDEAFIGGHFIQPLERNWVFNPNFEYVLVEEGSLFTINADFHYDFPSRSSTLFWLGAGLGVSRFSLDDESNTDVGLNALTGASFGRGPVTPFVQAKVMIFDDTQLVIGGGITF